MKLPIRLLNSLWLMLPLLAWNIVLGPRITNEKVLSDAFSPQWLLILENVTRLAVFCLPLFIPLQLESRGSKLGLAVFIIGTLIYFTSWLPLLLAPESAWSNSAAGLLAPRLTPLLPFLGIALIGSSWPYAALSTAFIFLHTLHGVQNL
ncbi:MAG: hypothetical protein JXB38_15000 [Anaerolineales bacterium]|nr:hypothetical protein [Anaerolineales bacterium]